MSNFDKLNQLKKPMNLEKDVRTIKKIVSTPNRVYGHGLVDVNDYEKPLLKVDFREVKLASNFGVQNFGFTEKSPFFRSSSCLVSGLAKVCTF